MYVLDLKIKQSFKRHSYLRRRIPAAAWLSSSCARPGTETESEEEEEDDDSTTRPLPPKETEWYNIDIHYSLGRKLRLQHSLLGRDHHLRGRPLGGERGEGGDEEADDE